MHITLSDSDPLAASLLIIVIIVMRFPLPLLYGWHRKIFAYVREAGKN